MPPAKLTIQNDQGVAVRTLAVTGDGQPLLADVLAENGVPVNTRCGKQGWCHGCVVELVRPGLLGEVTLQEVKSCELRLERGEDLVVRVPRHARLEAQPQVGDSFEIDVPVVLDPPWPIRAGESDLAVAVDVGTTTVAAALVDLTTGEVLARAGDFNAQIRFGDNVVTRIVAASATGAREAMQKAVARETIASLIAEVCRKAGRETSRLAGIVVAGNTTMLHLLAGEDPAGLGVVPFTPRFLDTREIPARQLGLEYDFTVTLLPGFSAYVGADLAAGVYATGMFCDARPSLLVDIGTNGEIVLQAGGKFIGCATAAGPAFEGAGLLSGTRAQAGAISRVRIEDAAGGFEFSCETIGDGAPENAPGLCGTAYVDILAEGRTSGLLLPSGRFAQAAWEKNPETRRMLTQCGRALRLAGNVSVGEGDLAALLQAKAAIGAGITTLLDTAGLKAADIGRLYLAGGFGLYIDVDHAIEIGLLPGFEKAQVKVVGNSSLGGAILAALDRNALRQIDACRARTIVLELNEQPGFEDSYLDHLALP